MKLRPKIWSVTWRYLLVAAIIIAIVFGFTFNFYFVQDTSTGVLKLVTFGFSYYFIIALLITILIGFYILSIFFYYYKIDEYSFSMFRFGKEYVFEFKNIEFIDIEVSKKKNQIIFYSPKSRTRYLLGDKDGKVLETLIKKCPKILSVEEFKKKHPEERY